MGWFSWIKKVVDPVVTAVEEATEAFVQTVVEPLAEAVTNVASSVWETVTKTAAGIAEAVSDAVGGLVDTVSEEAFEVAINTAEHIFDNGYQPSDPDLSRFEPVVPVADQVQSMTIDSADWTTDETIEIRDVVVAAQIGYADYSELFAAGAINADGYVISTEAVYAEAGWLDGIVSWASERFEIIRILEDASSSLLGGFEANVTLTQNIVTGDYFIGIGGTNSLGDVLTDLNLVLGEDTGASEVAITDMIGQFFADDIEAGATVNLSGHSLGGAEAVLQYRDDPDMFDHVYAIQAVGIGGFDGTYYDQTIWDGMGDANITEITGDDPGTDFNDLVTYWGHIGAGKTYHVAEVENAVDDGNFFEDLELVDAHLLDNLWASLPGGQDPVLPVIDNGADSFDFA